MRFYRIDLLDFFRGTLSARRLGVLVRQLPVESALVRALNGGQTPWGSLEHLVADLWAQQAGQDHPVRAEKALAARTEAKRALKAKFKQRKAKYEGLG